MNAKMRRTGVCGATETILVDRAYPAPLAIIDALVAAGCEVRGDKAIMVLSSHVEAASTADWDCEYLDAIVSIAMVDGLDGALAHIDAHSSRHTDAIVTEDAATAERFLAEVDSAIVMHNASTQFADGGEFASAPKSASPRVASTPAARSRSKGSRHINGLCAARVRSGLDGN